MNTASRIGQGLRRLSIFNRVLLGNSVVIIIGAIGGTLITRHLSTLEDINLILLFSSLGIVLSLLITYWIIKSALHPLIELQEAVSQIKEGHYVPLEIPEIIDPVIQDLTETINLTLENLEKRTLQLTALSERSINVQEEERKRIARGLHDDTAQAISTLIIHLEQLENELPEGMSEIRDQIANERQLATLTLEDLRKNIWDLRPSILDDLGLASAIRWYARTKLDEVGIAVEFDFRNGAVRFRHPMETMLFRISQEAVNNILHHAEANKVLFRLWQEKDQINLVVEDNGRGFDVGQTAGQALSRKQFGLLGIQERVSLLGGEMDIDSTPGKGTRLQIHVPLFSNNLVEEEQATRQTMESR